MATRIAPFDLVDRDFQDLVRRAFGTTGRGFAPRWNPALDVFTEGDALHVRVELPGIDPEQDVEIDVSEGVLRISGERRTEQESEEGSWYHREMTYGSFQRSIALPRGIDPDSVSATYDAGILDVEIPIPEKPRNKVKVEIGGPTKKKELND